MTSSINKCKIQRSTEPLAVSKSEAARMLGVSRPQIEKLIDSGVLRVSRLSERVLRIPVRDIRAALGLSEDGS